MGSGVQVVVEIIFLFFIDNFDLTDADLDPESESFKPRNLVKKVSRLSIIEFRSSTEIILRSKTR